MLVALGRRGLGRVAGHRCRARRHDDRRLGMTRGDLAVDTFLIIRSRTLMLLFLYGSSKRKRSICPALRLRKAVTVASASGNRCSFMGGRGPATIAPLRMR